MNKENELLRQDIFKSICAVGAEAQYSEYKKNIINVNTDNTNWEERKERVGNIVSELSSNNNVMYITSYKNDFVDKSNKISIVHTDTLSEKLLGFMPSADIIVIDIVGKVDYRSLPSEKTFVIIKERLQNHNIGKRQRIYIQDTDKYNEQVASKIKEIVAESEDKNIILITSGKTSYNDLRLDKDTLFKVRLCSTDNVDLVIRRESAEEKTMFILYNYNGDLDNLKSASDIIAFTSDTQESEHYYTIAQAVDLSQACDGFMFTNFRAVQAKNGKEALQKYVDNMNCGYTGVMIIKSGGEDSYTIIK